MTEFFSQPDDVGELRASDLHSSLGDTLSAQASEAVFSGTRTLFRNAEYAAARGGGFTNVLARTSDTGAIDEATSNQLDQAEAAVPDVSIDDAKARVKQAGLSDDFKLPDQPTIKGPVLDLMLQHAQERRDYQATIARGPQGFIPDALGFATSIGAGLIDPVNLAAFAIPIMGEARMGMMIAKGGESLLARGAIKAGIGAGQGIAGTAVLQPAEWWLHSNDGVDYTMADALHSVIMGGAMGGVFHAGFGAFGDLAARRRGAPLEGSPEDLISKGLMSGRKVPDHVLDAPVSLDEIPGISAPIKAPKHPAEVLTDLPDRAKEDVMRAAMADVIQGNPVKASELLQESAKEDPRIAESTDAYFEQALPEHMAEPVAEDESANVRIAANQSRFLDFDAPLKDQPEVLARLRETVPTALREQFDQRVEDGLTGGNAYKNFVGAGEQSEGTSKVLNDAGIPGIRYKDQSPRDVTGNGEEAKSNFIIFNDKLVKIKPKNGDEVGLHEFRQARGLSADGREWPPLPQGARVIGSGDHGPVVEGLRGRLKDALAWLRNAQTGDARGVLEHPGVDGPIDIVWGDKRHGLAHIDGKHPGDADALPDLWPGLEITKQTEKHIELRSAEAHAVIARDFDGNPKQWLLTFFRRNRPTEETLRGPGDYEAAAQSTASPDEGNVGRPDESRKVPSEPGARDETSDNGRPGAQKADWARLQGERVDPTDRDLLEASAEAAKAPEIPSTEEPEKSISAAEAAAKEADKLLEDILPQLTDEERIKFEDALRKVAGDKEAREQIVRDGMACLLQASGG